MWTQDLRFALRTLWRSPAFTALAVLILALAIGGNSAIFSVVNGVLLKPLPYQEPQRLVRVFGVWPKYDNFPMSPADFLDYRSRNHVFSDLALYARRDLDLVTSDRPERLAGMAVSAGFFRLLGYEPILGSAFAIEDEKRQPVAPMILSNGAWQRFFAGDRTIIGRRLTLSGRSFAVSGIMAPGFQHVGGDYHSLPHGENVDFWIPLTLEAGRAPRGSHFLNAIARLNPGVSREQAQSEMNVIAAQLEKEYPDTNRDGRVKLSPLKQDIVGNAGTMLWVLLAAVGCVLMIACANIANLLLVRASARQREVAIRSALGAGRKRILRQLLTENLVIAGAGGIAGMVVAIGGMNAIVVAGQGKLPRLQEVGIDARMLAFTVCVTIATGLLFGFAPALSMLKTNLVESLKDGDRGATAGVASKRLKNILVIAEIALAFVLLTGAGLLLRSFLALQNVTPGFRPDHLLTAQVALPGARYPKGADVAAFYDRLVLRLRALPGVEAAGAGSDIPWSGYNENSTFEVVSHPLPLNQQPSARYHFVTPDYFRALGTLLVSGRFLTDRDTADAPPVVLVNAAFANRFFPREEAAGKMLKVWGKTVSIAGVVGDVKDTPASLRAEPAFYWPLAIQQNSDLTLTIRTAGDPAGIAEAVRRGVEAVDPQLPVTEVRSMERIAAGALSGSRFAMSLVATFAALAILLAAVGIYGVMSHSVNERVHEIGVRIALGAQRGEICRMFLKHGLRLAVAGIVVGAIAAAALMRLLTNMLYGVSSVDLWTFIAVAIVCALATLTASFAPVRHAAAVDPATSLRYE
jgi:putative ABC transport system permease protein